MAPTIEDLFMFLKQDKKERAQEREQDKCELRELIKEGVQNEVKSLVAPVIERVSNVELEQENMSKQIKVISEELRELKEELKNRDAVSQSADHVQSSGQVLRPILANSDKSDLIQPRVNRVSSDLLEIISLGRRTIGLQKIDHADLERMRQEQYGGAKTDEEEKYLAVQEYLRCELKIDSETMKSMKIERIFQPAMANPNHLYVTFQKEASVAKIYEKTRIMRAGSRILYYIPSQFKYRAKAIREIEYQLRHDKKYQTRIKMGLYDLELWKRVRGARTNWEKVILPTNLPPVDFTMTTDSLINGTESQSPPPGRPGQRSEKRDRESSGSENGIEDRSKVSRKENTFIEALEKANLVGEATISPTKDGEGLEKNVDCGKVLSVSGTPAKLSLSSDCPNSPIIFSKISKK